MTEKFEEFENEAKPQFISDKNLFIKIWTSPREVFKYLNSYKYNKYVTILLVLVGISRAFDQASTKNLGDRYSIWGLIALCVIMGAIFGWLTYYIYAALLNWTGKWLKGKGDTKSILRMLSFALIPSIVSLLLLIPPIFVYGNELFKADGDVTSGSVMANMVVYSALILEFALGIWSLVLCVIGISEVQQLSIGKSILNVFLPLLVLFVPLLIIALIFAGFR